jgi:hypothetical protein
MRIIYFGDVVGKAGRKKVLENIENIKKELKVDFTILNGENSAHGFGLSEKICNAFFNSGVDVITTGNHAFDKSEIYEYIKKEKRLIRPQNYPFETEGRGFGIFQVNNKKIMVAQFMGRQFMDPLDCPFIGADRLLTCYRLKKEVDAIIVDIHGEATSEKVAFGHYLDGRASLVAGTHTHIPTADEQILNNGTGYISDVGMCGDYDSVIGMKKETSIPRFTTRLRKSRFEPAEEDATICAVFIETDDETGLTKNISRLVIGDRLKNIKPNF